MAAVTSTVILESKNIKVCHSFHCLPIYLPWSGGTRCHDLWFMNVEFEASFFSLTYFTFMKRLFNSSLLSAVRVVSSAYMNLLIFSLLLFPACASSCLAFHKMYSAYMLNKQDDNIQPWCTPFPIWNQSVVPWLVLTLDFDLHRGFSGGRYDDLVFPSLEEFSTVSCSLHSQEALTWSMKQK